MSESDVRGFYPGTNRPLPSLDDPEGAPAGPREETPWDFNPTRKWVNGEPREFFTIGALVAALGRPVVTIRLWTRQGHLPQARYRNPDRNGVRGRRLYTREQVEAVVRVFRQHSLLDVERVDWSKHPSVGTEIAEAWNALPPL